LQHYGLPTEGSADYTDPGADGHTTWQEWRCLTDPTNALSVLRLLSASPADTNVTLGWQSVGRDRLFPGALHEAVVKPAIHPADPKPPRPAWRDQFRGHQRGRRQAVLLPRGRGELRPGHQLSTHELRLSLSRLARNSALSLAACWVYA